MFHLNDPASRRWRYPATSCLLRGVALRDMTCDLMTLRIVMVHGGMIVSVDGSVFTGS
jgi:hypothetical protein